VRFHHGPQRFWRVSMTFSVLFLAYAIMTALGVAASAVLLLFGKGK
jgi:hypothetical protein